MLKHKVAANPGSHTMLDNALIESLQERFLCEIIRLSDVGYDDSRPIWNAMIDKYPALIAR